MMNTKLLSFCIPSYNSEAYMEKCVDSILVGGNEVEILIIDDGSKDRTAEIADRYEKMYPDIVKAIHQENAGHGGAVNAGIRNATGLYFKVVDSDDWVDEQSLHKVIELLRSFQAAGRTVDMVLSNYVLENIVQDRQNVIKPVLFPSGKVIGWQDMKKPRIGQYLMMHSVIYLTSILKAHSFTLPEHTFYVDNLFVYEPLMWVKSIYYLDVDFYRYLIGRSDQSVNEDVNVRRIDQLIRVNKLMMERVNLNSVENRRLKEYLFLDLEIITVITSVFLLIPGTKENEEKKKDLWNYMEQQDPEVCHRIKHRFLGYICTRNDRIFRKFDIWLFRTIRKKRGN